MAEIEIVKYRVHAWLDTSKIADAIEELPLLYGIQAKAVGSRHWHHIAEDNKPLLFKEAAEAKAWIAANPPGPVRARFAEVAPR